VLNKLNTSDVEYAVAKYFNPRINLIVPNVWWGLGFNHELDLLICSNSRYCTEVEIKVSRSDIKADGKKGHNHDSKKIKRFFYAVPDSLADCEHLPVDCGLIVVDLNLRCKTVRPPRINRIARPLDDWEYLKLLQLAAMRVWTLKETLMENRRYREARKSNDVPKA